MLNPVAILYSSVLSCGPDDAVIAGTLTLQYSNCSVVLKTSLFKSFFLFLLV